MNNKSNKFNNRLHTQTISKAGKYELSAQIAPEMGANLVSFKVNESELIYFNHDLLLNHNKITGAFNMFPTPCRLENCSYEFENKKIHQVKHGHEVFMHGLIRDEVFEWQKTESSVTSHIDITPKHPVYRAFPFRCNIQITHTITEDGLRLSVLVENKDTCNIPLTYGVHPYWNIQGQRKDNLLKIPCNYTMPFEGQFPTGEIQKVDGSELDLRKYTGLENLFIDNVFWKKEPKQNAEILFKALEKKVVIETSDIFTHMIVYSPKGQPYFCVENLTGSPNAQNLAAKGFNKESGLIILPVGKKIQGRINYSIEESL
jgi:aldose 1-epimerase